MASLGHMLQVVSMPDQPCMLNQNLVWIGPTESLNSAGRDLERSSSPMPCLRIILIQTHRLAWLGEASMSPKLAPNASPGHACRAGSGMQISKSAHTGRACVLGPACGDGLWA